jgi:hypothetical protein
MMRGKCPRCRFCGCPERGNPASPAVWTALAGLAARLIVSWAPEVFADVWDRLTSW